MEPCVEDADCPGSRSCVRGLCPEPALCQGPLDCDRGRVCVQEECRDECGADHPCPGSQVCNEETALCEESGPCESDHDCLGQRRCSAGACVEPCVEDADCPGSRSCVGGLCPEPEICILAEDCDPGRVCAARACVPACGPEQPCPGRQGCDPDTGLCREPPRCLEELDCLGQRLCFHGACVDPCESDADCQGTRHCLDSVCPEPELCFTPADCDPGRVCLDHHCRDTCDEHRPCPGRQVCDEETLVCTEPERCEEELDCLDERFCLAGRCTEPCGRDEDCPGAQRCQADTGRCEEPDHCVGDQDCLEGRVCEQSACFLPECEENDDCPAVCVDRRCAAAAPAACGPGSACPEPQICAPLGACLLDGPCQDDEDCPQGTRLCDPDSQRCVCCRSDEDCSGAEYCVSGLCTFVGACGADEDCPGERRCDEEGFCAPAGGCDGDRFDVEDGVPELVARTYTGLLLCDGSQDLYSTTVAASEGLRVVLRHPPGEGDLSLALREAGADLEVLAQSDLRHGVEQVGVDPGPEERDLEIVVRGRPGASVLYAISLERLSEEDCVQDSFEGLLGNDDAAHASPIGLGAHEHKLCPGDEDWFALALPAGSRVALTATTDGAAHALLLDLLGPDGTLIAQGRDDGGTLLASAEVGSPGRHLIRIRANDADALVPVLLEVSAAAVDGAEALACDHPLPLEPARPTTFPRFVPVPRFSISCGQEQAADHLAAFELAQPALVSAQAVRVLGLAIRGVCTDPGSEVVCASGPDPVLEEVFLDAGTWYLVVQSFGLLPPEVLLTARAQCELDVDCGDGSVCDGGICHAPCLGHGDCPGAQSCEPATGHCLEPEVCQDPADCLGLRACRHDGVCFLPQCEESSDCQVACVDRSCADGPPVECRGDEDCPGQQTCVQAGACLLDEPCTRDEDCPAGAPLCAPAHARCLVCRSDNDCATSEACRQGRCLYLGLCEEDEDCPGERVCAQSGECEPAGECAGDRFDTIPGLSALLPRTYTGLLLCDGSQDLYSTTVAASEGLRVVLRHDPSGGDLSLALTDDGVPAVELARSDHPHGVEVLGLDAAPQAHTVHIEVRGRPGFSVSYSLTLERQGPEACAPDGLEGLLGNDDAAHATWINAGLQDHALCPGDEDWFVAEVSAGTRLTARATPVQVEVQMALSLLAPEHGTLAVGVDDGQSQVLSADIIVPGRHQLRVHSPRPDGRTRVQLELGASPADRSETLACAHPTPLLAGELLTFARTLPARRFLLSCGLVQDVDYLATFELGGPASISLQVVGGDTVALRSVCDDAGSELICVSGVDPSLKDLDLEAGAWFVVVQSFGDQVPEIMLEVH